MVAALPTGARSPGIDPAKLVAEARTNKWREENGRAFIDANAFLDRFGLWSDGKRSF
jgi:post-segregation antitoxin (ccd killing protein)